MGGVWKAEEGRRKKGRFYLKKSLTKMGAKCISFFFFLPSFTKMWGVRKAEEGRRKNGRFCLSLGGGGPTSHFFVDHSEASR